MPPAQLESIAHRFDEEVFPEGERVLRKNLTGSGLFVILDGQAVVRIDEEEVTRFGPAPGGFGWRPPPRPLPQNPLGER